MCLLTYLPAGVLPDTDALLNGIVVNQDGHGFAIVAGDRLVIERGMDGEQLVAAFERARRRHRDGPALFHSRYATHGVADLDNCHPFHVGGDVRTVVAHNGVLPATVQPRRGDPRSDTRYAAEVYLPQAGGLHLRRTRQRLERWMTPFNKLVLLTVDHRFKQQGYVLNEASGIWDDGIWYSNDDYRRPPVPAWLTAERFGVTPPQWLETVAGLERCPDCGTPVDIVTDVECPCCGWCYDCGERPSACACYTPPPQYLQHRQGFTTDRARRR
jgi:glutamine amidotransferase